MTPATPVLPRQPKTRDLEIVFAKDQPEYLPLPAIRTSDGQVITRWRLSWADRFRLLWSGDLFLRQLTFNGPLQPQSPTAYEPEITFE